MDFKTCSQRVIKGEIMYKYIYQLHHVYISIYTDKKEPLYQIIELGYFSSAKKAEKIIEKYIKLKGFKDYPKECFKIRKMKLEILENKNQKNLFELYHSHFDKDNYEEYEYLGVFPSREKAKEKINELIKKKSKYAKFKEGFDISEEIIDSDNTIWDEGFDNDNHGC